MCIALDSCLLIDLYIINILYVIINYIDVSISVQFSMLLVVLRIVRQVSNRLLYPAKIHDTKVSWKLDKNYYLI